MAKNFIFWKIAYKKNLRVFGGNRASSLFYTWNRLTCCKKSEKSNDGKYENFWDREREREDGEDGGNFKGPKCWSNKKHWLHSGIPPPNLWVGAKISEKFGVCVGGGEPEFPFVMRVCGWEKLGGKANFSIFLWGGNQPRRTLCTQLSHTDAHTYT